MGQPHSPCPACPTLTAREVEVVELLLSLAPNKLIATELGCSVKTVEFHVTNILRKKGVSSRWELVMKMLERRP